MFLRCSEIIENNNKMINDEISLIEINEEITCYRCGSVSDIEDSHCNNCGTPLREDLVLL